MVECLFMNEVVVGPSPVADILQVPKQKNHKYDLDCCQQKPQLFDENPFPINGHIHITNFVIPCENNAKCIRKK